MLRALASYHCGPGSNPGVDAVCGLILLLVLSFVTRGFSPGTTVFPSPKKNPDISKFQSDQESGRREEPLSGCATSNSLFIYLIVKEKISMISKYIWTTL